MSGPRPPSSRVGLTLLALGILLPAPAAAQACLGGVLAAGLRAVVIEAGRARYDLGTTAEGTDVGVAYWANPGGRLGYSLGLTRRLMDNGPADLTMARVGGDWRVPVRLPAAARLCLATGASAAWLGGAGRGTDYTSYALPIGLEAGVPVSLGAGVAAIPYLHPRLLWVRGRGEVLGIPVEESYTALAGEAGAAVGWRRLVGRVQLSTAWRPRGAGAGPVADARVGILLGVRF